MGKEIKVVTYSFRGIKTMYVNIDGKRTRLEDMDQSTKMDVLQDLNDAYNKVLRSHIDKDK